MYSLFWFSSCIESHLTKFLFVCKKLRCWKKCELKEIFINLKSHLVDAIVALPRFSLSADASPPTCCKYCLIMAHSCLFSRPMPSFKEELLNTRVCTGTFHTGVTMTKDWLKNRYTIPATCLKEKITLQCISCFRVSPWYHIEAGG